MKIRRPRDTEHYLPAERVAAFLEEIAADIREGKEKRPLVKYRLAVSYWNPEWEKGE
jgi:hypothetical protein